MIEFDPGSFKDQEGRVFVHNGRVFRTLSPDALVRMEQLENDGFLSRLAEKGILLASWLVSTDEIGMPADQYGRKIMEHEPVPVITYPYEWSFSMLRASALLTLDLLEQCLHAKMTLKDGTPFNLMYHRGRMRFIDTLSIDSYHDGQPWNGYSQFCKEFLFPLMLTGYLHIEFHPWLRGSLKGITAREMARLLRIRHYFRRGVLVNVVLQAHFEKMFGKQDIDVLKEARPVFSAHRILAIAAKLRRTIGAIHYKVDEHMWVNYREENPYSDEEADQKALFIEEVLAEQQPSQVIDIGCNTGQYSRLAAKTVDRVIAMDVDPSCIDILYQELLRDGVNNVVPMVANLTDPSPPLGWNLTERRSLFDRVKSDGFLALALIHHICIGCNIPLPNFLRMLAKLGKWGVIEWVDKSDPMVRKLLRNRQDIFVEYTWEKFQETAKQMFNIRRICEMRGGRRKLCYVVPKDG